MSIEAMAAVLHHSRAKGTAKLVLLGIANHQGDGGAWPSIPTLAAYANTSERSVQRSIDSLVGKGELRRAVQAGGPAELPDHTRPNRYDVLVSCPPWCDRSFQHRDTRKLSGRQLGLWTNRVTPVSPGDASVTGGVTPVSPGGVTPVSPKPSTEPRHHQVVPQVQDARARANSAPCQDCGADEWTCQRRQARLVQDDYHPYRAPTP